MKYYTKAERKHHVVQQSMSDLTIGSYCKKHEINYHTFDNWRRKYKKLAETKDDKSSSRSFLEVKAPRSGISIGKTNIYLPNGVRIQLDRSEEHTSELQS